MRELAQRSAAAAREIKTLINTSGEEVKRGVQLVSETGRALTQIVAQVQDINTNVAAIVEGAREQAAGLKEVNTAVNLIDQGTQQNAAMVEESNAASQSLAKEAQSLFMLINQFRIDGGEVTKKPARNPAPVAVAAAAPGGSVKELRQRVRREFQGNAAVAERWEDF